MKRIVSDNEFVVYHEDLKTNLYLKQISQVPESEDLTNWIMLPPHSNLAACFDTFEHDVGEQVYYFSLSEVTNAGNMYSLIKAMKL